MTAGRARPSSEPGPDARRSPAIRVSGAGCCVMDLLYDVPEGQDRLAPWLSRVPGDGGLVRGGAVLKSDLERRTAMSVDAWLAEVVGDVQPRRSLGGVGVVTLIAAAQLLPAGSSVEFHGCVSDDADGDWLLGQIARTPLGRARLCRRRGRPPTTVILNERHAGRAPDRSFVAEPCMPDSLALEVADLDPDFFHNDVVAFSFMPWEPKLFARLTSVVERCKRSGSLTVMGTAFDAARTADGRRWPLGDSDEVHRRLDVLVMDQTEALRYSGEPDQASALRFFQRSGVGAVVVTNGESPVRYWSGGSVCAPAEGEAPIPSAIVVDRDRGLLPTGDTVGCGDNFAGGVIASLALQKAAGRRIDLLEAVRLGSLSGALASTHAGGVFFEKAPGEKRALVARYCEAYEEELRRG